MNTEKTGSKLLHKVANGFFGVGALGAVLGFGGIVYELNELGHISRENNYNITQTEMKKYGQRLMKSFELTFVSELCMLGGLIGKIKDKG